MDFKGSAFNGVEGQSPSPCLAPLPNFPAMQQMLRRGWTTGACAAAAAKAAWAALTTGVFPDPVGLTLPRGECPVFALAETWLGEGAATAAIVKDAGDDPDVTHGALVRVTVRRAPPGSGVVFRAGEGVGTVTLPGLPLPPGEPAINPGPRAMIAAALAEVAPGDVEVTVAIPGGKVIALRTMNARLGVLGGLSILGTTGVVVPYSCAAWIHTIHRGIDVARATGLRHVAGATGSTSEAAVRRHFALPEQALIDMGDFVGGMLKYLRAHPVGRVTVAGGPAKLGKLAQGRMDLHSHRGSIDLAGLAALASARGGDASLAGRIESANTAALAFAEAEAAGIDLPGVVCAAARGVAAEVAGPAIALDVLMVGRDGRVIGHAGPDPDPGLNRRT